MDCFQVFLRFRGYLEIFGVLWWWIRACGAFPYRFALWGSCIYRQISYDSAFYWEHLIPTPNSLAVLSSSRLTTRLYNGFSLKQLSRLRLGEEVRRQVSHPPHLWNWFWSISTMKYLVKGSNCGGGSGEAGFDIENSLFCLIDHDVSWREENFHWHEILYQWQQSSITYGKDL